MAKDKNDQTKAVKNGGQEGGVQNKKSLKSKDDKKKRLRCGQEDRDQESR